MNTMTKTPCPNCGRPTKPAELRQWSGVCRFCKRAFQAANRGWIRNPTKHLIMDGSGQWDGIPSRPSSSQDELYCEADGHHTDVTPFDTEAVENALGEFQDASVGAREEAAALLSRLWTWLWHPSLYSQKTPLLRLYAFVAAVRPEVLNNETGGQLAQHFGVSKQTISTHMLDAEAYFDTKFSRTRSSASRRKMAQAATGHAPTNFKKCKSKPTSGKAAPGSGPGQAEAPTGGAGHPHPHFEGYHNRQSES